VLRAIGSGVTIDDLRVKLRDRWVPCQRALFSLLARHHATLQRGHAVHPDAWKKILADLEASLALAALGSSGTPLPAPPVPTPPVQAAETRSPALEGKHPPAKAPEPAKLPAPGKPRSEDAQACFTRGLAEVEAGQIHTGVALLRRAAQLAPGDPEISAALWKASSTAASRR
jgi:hypothetical protein